MHVLFVCVCLFVQDDLHKTRTTVFRVIVTEELLELAETHESNWPVITNNNI